MSLAKSASETILISSPGDDTGGAEQMAWHLLLGINGELLEGRLKRILRPFTRVDYWLFETTAGWTLTGWP